MAKVAEAQIPQAAATGRDARIAELLAEAKRRDRSEGLHASQYARTVPPWGKTSPDYGEPVSPKSAAGRSWLRQQKNDIRYNEIIAEVKALRAQTVSEAATQPATALPATPPQGPPPPLGAGGGQGPSAPPSGVPPLGTTGGPAPMDADKTMAFLLHSPESFEADALKTEMYARQRAAQGNALNARVKQLTDGGMGDDLATKQAEKEVLSGPLDRPSMDVAFITSEIRAAAFRKLTQFYANAGLKQAAAHTALSNALAGIPIPRDPGKEGGSAWKLLADVFGEPMVAAIDGLPLGVVVDRKLMPPRMLIQLTPEEIAAQEEALRRLRSPEQGRVLPVGGVRTLPKKLPEKPRHPESPEPPTVLPGQAGLVQQPGENVWTQAEQEMEPQAPDVRGPFGPKPSGPPFEVGVRAPPFDVAEWLKGYQDRYKPVNPSDFPSKEAARRETLRRVNKELSNLRWRLMRSVRPSAERDRDYRFIKDAIQAKPEASPVAPRRYTTVPPHEIRPAIEPIAFDAQKWITEYQRRQAKPGPFSRLFEGETARKARLDADRTVEAARVFLTRDPRPAAEKTLDLEAFKAAIDPGPKPKGVPYPEPRKSALGQQLSNLPPDDKARLISIFKASGMTALDFGNLLRANMASVDLSYLRQQVALLWAHPTDISMGTAVKSIFSEKYFQEVAAEIARSKHYQLYEQLGLDFLRPLPEKELGGLYQAEETFQVLGRTGQKLRPLQKLATKLPWVTASNRGFVAGINSMNWKIWSNYVDNLYKINEQMASGLLTPDTSAASRLVKGVGGVFNEQMAMEAAGRRGMIPPRLLMEQGGVKGGGSFSVAKEAEALGRMLEDMSGRARLGKSLQGLSPAMNAGFFSLRLHLGRLMTVTRGHLWHKSPYVRQQAWRNVLTFVAGMLGVELAGEQMGLWEVEKDPRSADFLKMRIGRIRFDPWGGYQQWAVLVARLVPVLGGLKSTETGQVRPVDPVDTSARFARTKAAPLIGNTLEAWVGTDYTGSKIDRSDWKRWIAQNLPMSGVDIYEAFDKEGLTGLPALTSLLGVGVSTYDLPRWPELDAYYRLKGADSGETTALRRKFREENPEAEAKLFIRGDITTLSTPQARTFVRSLMKELKVNPKNVPGYKKVFGVVVAPSTTVKEYVNAGAR